MAFTADAYIAAAEKYVGYNEKDHGGKTKFGQWYGDRVKNKAFYDAAWCDMFACYCAWEVGGEEALETVGFFAYTPHHASWFARNGRWGSKPTKGALGFIDWQGGSSGSISQIDHVGIVKGVDIKGRVVMVEGNTSDRVAIRYRDRSLFVGFGYPKFDKAASVTTVKTDTKDKVTSTAKPKTKPAIGSSAPKFPLDPNDWFSRTRHNGYNNKKDRDGVRRFQARLKERGWKIDADGYFGPITDKVVKAFQHEKRLAVDGAVGRITWAAIWNAPIT